MYKIYSSNHVICISERPTHTPEVEVLEVSELTDALFAKVLKKVQTTKHLELISTTPEALFTAFSARFTPIEAGGGLVTNPAGEVLMIHRNGHWDLPKGKLEQGEGIEQCALREVEEECSVGGLQLESFLCHTYHLYLLRGAHILKRTWWYKMSSPTAQTPQPQTIEGIDTACWVAPTQIAERLAQSYGTIAEVFSAGGYTE